MLPPLCPQGDTCETRKAAIECPLACSGRGKCLDWCAWPSGWEWAGRQRARHGQLLLLASFPAGLLALPSTTPTLPPLATRFCHCDPPYWGLGCERGPDSAVPKEKQRGFVQPTDFKVGGWGRIGGWADAAQGAARLRCLLPAACAAQL